MKTLELDRCNCIYAEDVPELAILDCSHPGDCAEDVAFWRKRLSFTVPAELARKTLKGYGAWSAEELAAKSDTQLAETVLWIACGNFRDGETVFCLE